MNCAEEDIKTQVRDFREWAQAKIGQPVCADLITEELIEDCCRELEEGATIYGVDGYRKRGLPANEYEMHKEKCGFITYGYFIDKVKGGEGA